MRQILLVLFLIPHVAFGAYRFSLGARQVQLTTSDGMKAAGVPVHLSIYAEKLSLKASPGSFLHLPTWTRAVVEDLAATTDEDGIASFAASRHLRVDAKNPEAWLDVGWSLNCYRGPQLYHTATYRLGGTARVDGKDRGLGGLGAEGERNIQTLFNETLPPLLEIRLGQTLDEIAAVKQSVERDAARLSTAGDRCEIR